MRLGTAGGLGLGSFMHRMVGRRKHVQWLILTLLLVDFLLFESPGV